MYSFWNITYCMILDFSILQQFLVAIILYYFLINAYTAIQVQGDNSLVVFSFCIFTRYLNSLQRMESRGTVRIPGVNEAEGSETTIEIKIKTLDSQTYTLRVDKQVIFAALLSSSCLV